MTHNHRHAIFYTHRGKETEYQTALEGLRLKSCKFGTVDSTVVVATESSAADRWLKCRILPGC
jgi:hypothetical protein